MPVAPVVPKEPKELRNASEQQPIHIKRTILRHTVGLNDILVAGQGKLAAIIDWVTAYIL